MGGWGEPRTSETTTCPLCAALVADRDAHRNWHEALRRQMVAEIQSARRVLDQHPVGTA